MPFLVSEALPQPIAVFQNQSILHPGERSCPLERGNLRQGELLKQMVIPFGFPPHPEKLRPLASLPFTAIFTANYDRSLHDAVASITGKSPKTVELGDPTMAKAPYFTDFYIGRLHGRMEVPETVVLTSEDYRRLEEDTCYIDFVRHILTRHSCLFLGFSFVDPAIENVFQLIKARLGPAFPKLHLAILSADSDSKLKNELAHYNIRVAEYTSGKHTLLWEGISLASRSLTPAQKTIKPSTDIPLDTVRQFVSTAYARSKLSSELQPLRDVVLDGIVLDIVRSAGTKGTTLQDVSSALRQLLALSENQSKNLVQRRIEVLSLFST